MVSVKLLIQWSSLLLSGMLLVVVQNASADCNIFVSATDGNDILGTGDALLPFKTIQRGADAALTPGDTVCVRPGIYFENNQEAPTPDIKGVKARAGGAPGNPIIFQADPNVVGTVIIDMGFDLTQSPGAIKDPGEALGFFILAFDHVTIRGFEIRNVTAGVLTQGKINPVAGFVGEYDPPTNIIIENNHIHDVRRDQRDGPFDSNLAPVRPNDCYDCIIRGNRLHGVSQIVEVDESKLEGFGNFKVVEDIAGPTIFIENFINQNSAGVHSFGMLRTIIENNEIYDVHSGIRFKSWTNQPLPGDPEYNPALIPPSIDKVNDFGVKIRRNLIHDTVLGVRLTPSGGSGRVISAKGNAHGNPAFYNTEISENVFYSTEVGAQRLSDAYARMEWALKTDLRGTVEQSERLQFFNNTVITHNGVDIDAVSDVKIYNNFFSLSENTSFVPAINGPEIAIQTRYSRIDASLLLNSGTQLNLGTPAVPVPVAGAKDCEDDNSCNCNLAPDPDLTDNGGVSPVSTQPFSPADTEFFCTDNVQWAAQITVSDFNYFHVGKNFRLNRYGTGGNGVQGAGVEQLQSSLADWQALTAGGDNFGLADNLPDENSTADLAPASDFLVGVTINPNGGVTIDPANPTPFLHPAALDSAGRVGGLAGGAPVNIGAFPKGVFDPNIGPFDSATDSGFIGTPRFVNAPGGISVD